MTPLFAICMFVDSNFYGRDVEGEKRKTIAILKKLKSS